ncbi:MAG: hypothetical protein ACUVUH_06145, partial [bacterium]
KTFKNQRGPMVLSNIYIICVALEKAREQKTNSLFLMAYSWLRYYNTKRKHAGDNLDNKIPKRLCQNSA